MHNYYINYTNSKQPNESKYTSLSYIYEANYENPAINGNMLPPVVIETSDYYQYTIYC